MVEKVYCSQCHISVFRANKYAAILNPQKVYKGKCLYCYALHRYLDWNAKIGACIHCEPESRQKLLSGRWKANQAEKKTPQ